MTDSDWIRLDIDDEHVAVLAHLTLKQDADEQTRARDIWPQLAEEDGAARLQNAYATINRAASAATGKPGAVLGSSSAFGLPRPELYVHVMTAEPYVEVR